MSTIAVNAITDANDGNTTTINGVTPNSANVVGKNRIINGNMVIDQRNAGASVTPINGTYVIDRWKQYQSAASKYSVQQNAGGVTPPAGFANYLGVVSLSSYTSSSADYFTLEQTIEGYNVADLGWGTADAKSVTVSFWVRSSLTGTFGGSIKNKSSGANRSYPFSFVISVANTWERKTITVIGDTTGIWLNTNGLGITLSINLGTGTTYSGPAGAWAATNYLSATGATSVVGTSGATFYITGVQLEVGESATEFEHRPYTTELQLCQRYCCIPADGSITSGAVIATGAAYTSGNNNTPLYLKVTMRAVPTLTQNTGSGYYVYYYNGTSSSTSSLTLSGASTNDCILLYSGASTATGAALDLRMNNANAKLILSAEL